MKKIYFLLLVFSFFSTANAQIVNIPDANFKAKLLAANTTSQIATNLNGNFFKIDANNDGQIQESEALNVKSLILRGSNNAKIFDLSGIESFRNLKFLDCSNNNLKVLFVPSLNELNILVCSYNILSDLFLPNSKNLITIDCSFNSLTFLDVSNLQNLGSLNCSYNRLTSLNLSSLLNLTSLICNNNNLNSLDVSKLVNMTTLDCSSNQLNSLNVSSLIKLSYLSCYLNKLNFLDVSLLVNLTTLYCSNNQISNLDVSKLAKLFIFGCSNNLLSTLDVSIASNLTEFFCDKNQLESLFIKNGNSNYIDFSSNPNLKFICVDEAELVAIQNKVNSYGYTNCPVNSYCSFAPGGPFYTIQGVQKLDTNNNGCDGSDISIPNLKYSITNGTETGSIILDTSGNFSIPVQDGTHTITPVFENPSYFTVSPTSFNVTFPTQASPFTQNFCITANGVRPDLEVTLLPLQPARPGFDAKYKLVYKNKGNTIQSGSVNLNFTDAVLDLVVANPVASSQTANNLSWNFTALKPLETREISFTMNVNSPMEVPAVNNDDVLAYTATITSAVVDETPIDNTFTFNQTVVGSYDPNDKTCLEGSVITPNLIGQYVHYTIRFENTGTFAAENVVIKDMIDLAKFDISTLVPTSASHSYTTRISDGNKVEFIFENINLPFDDANNDGYIAFKIKTKPTLVVNDTFSNEASIFFDYNFPIVTNKATSTFKTLGTQDFDFDRYFTVYPNPATTVLNIASKESINIGTVNVYNTLGQLVLAIPNAEKVSNVDVSNLKSGNYFIQIKTDKGSSSSRFVKD